MAKGLILRNIHTVYACVKRANNGLYTQLLIGERDPNKKQSLLDYHECILCEALFMQKVLIELDRFFMATAKNAKPFSTNLYFGRLERFINYVLAI